MSGYRFTRTDDREGLEAIVDGEGGLQASRLADAILQVADTVARLEEKVRAAADLATAVADWKVTAVSTKDPSDVVRIESNKVLVIYSDDGAETGFFSSGGTSVEEIATMIASVVTSLNRHSTEFRVLFLRTMLLMAMHPDGVRVDSLHVKDEDGWRSVEGGEG